MATKRIVPRVTGEGGIGRTDKLMGPSYFSELGLSSKARIQETTLQTSNATPTVLWSRAIAEGEAVHVVAQIVCAKADLSGAGAFNRNAVVRRQAGGAAVLVKSGNIGTDLENPVTTNITWTLSGNTIQLLGTGIAATMINWRAMVTIVSL